MENTYILFPPKPLTKPCGFATLLKKLTETLSEDKKKWQETEKKNRKESVVFGLVIFASFEATFRKYGTRTIP